MDKYSTPAFILDEKSTTDFLRGHRLFGHKYEVDLVLPVQRMEQYDLHVVVCYATFRN